MTNQRSILGWTTLGLLSISVACGSDDSPGSDSHSSSDSSDDASIKADLGDDQTPPQGADNVEAWLEQGAYKNWRCEPEVHPSRAPSPHGFNRICSNDLLSADAAGRGEWAKGSAGVKELYASLDDQEPIGYAVYLKTADDSAGGANWYWYERLPANSEQVNGAPRVVADGLGTAGAAKDICVSCHLAAGIDADHTPTPGGRDQVYTPVP